MRRQEAIHLIKEIGVACTLLNPSAIFLERTTKSESYEIHIKANMDNDSWEGLKLLARRHGLGVKLNDRSLIIYKPMEKKYGQLIFA